MFEIRDLECFLAIVEHQSFHRAAMHLNMAQPPLSRRIAALERELGGALFVREGRHIKLTDIGRAFATAARALLNQAELAKRIVEELGRGLSGFLRVGYVGTTGYGLVPRALTSFRKEFPRAVLSVSEVSSRRQADALRGGALDVAIHLGTPDSTGLTVQRLHSDRLLVALPRAHRLVASRTIRIEDLANEPIVAVRQQGAGGIPDIVRVICSRAGFIPNIVQEVDEVGLLLMCVDMGMGLAFVNAGTRDSPFERIAYRNIAPPAPHLDLNVLTRSDESNPLVQPFIRHVIAALKTTP
jgi:DNA-binding transcriptional LysR family regulator